MNWVAAGMMVLGAAAAAAPSQAAICAARADVRAMTYNIRLDVAVDGANRWANRRAEFLAQIRLVQPDLLGLQEVVPGQYADLRDGLPGYAFVGGGRDDGAGQGEASPLAVSRQAFSIGASGMFWLSPTPEKPSMGWDSAYRRVATWAHLRRRSDGMRLLVLNTHWDHVGLEARRNSALLLRSWIAAHRRRGEAVVVLGDFNAPLSEASMQALLDDRQLRDSRAAAREPAVGTTITFNAFDPFPKSGQTIDHILVGGAEVVRYHALAEHFDGRVASDHFPVVADIAPACVAAR